MVVKIHLFDSIACSIDNMSVTLPYKQSEQALIYLILSYPNPVEKDVIAELLWPERPPGVARRNLRHAIHVLRSMLRLRGIVQTTKNLVHLTDSEEIECDYFSFRRLIEQGASASSETVYRILDLYKNGLLENYSAEPSAEYGFWLYYKRKTCANQLHAFLFSVIPGLCTQKAYPLLSDLAKRLMVWDPFDTSTYEFLIRSLMSRGENSFALYLHRDIAALVEKSGDSEALNGLADMARRVFPLHSYPVKKKLPQQIVPFIGREYELRRLEALVRNPDARLITVFAPGGYGKTSLAVALARRIDVAQFPDDIYFIDWKDCVDTEECIGETLKCLGLSREGSAIEDMVVRYVEDKKLLFIFDEVEEKQFAASFIVRMLNTGPNIKILVTTRKQLELKGEWIFPLHPFEVNSEAAEFFFRAVERKTGKKIWSEHEVELAEKICRLLSGIPLALEIAASRISDLDIDSLYRRLKNLPENFLTHEIAMERIIEYQLNLLSEEKRRKYYNLSLFFDDFDKQTALNAFSIPEEDFAEYCKLSLVWPAERGMFRIHNHIRTYCRACIQRAGESDSCLNLLCTHLASISEEHFKRMFSLKDDPQAVVIQYPAEIEQAWLFALRNHRWDVALKIAIPLGSYLYYFGLVWKGKELFKQEFEKLLRVGVQELSSDAYHLLLQIGLITAILEVQARNISSARTVVKAMQEIDRRGGYGFLTERRGEKDPFRQWLIIAYPWLQGLIALQTGNNTQAAMFFLSSHEKATKYSAHLCRVYVSIYRSMMIFDECPEEALDILKGTLTSSHSRHISGFRSEVHLLLAQFCFKLGKIEESKIQAESVLEATKDRPGACAEMEAQFLLALLHIGRAIDPEIPKLYVLRALATARKNGIYAIAVNSSLAYLHRFIEEYAHIPDLEVYESVSLLMHGQDFEKQKIELDRLFNLT